jgi:hypothetical protein
MSVSTYGIVRPADVSPSDVEIYWSYTTSRDATNNVTLNHVPDPSTMLKKVDDPNRSGEIFGGLYTLDLPVADFGAKGYYNIIIRPKQIRLDILDCGVLAAMPDIKGIVLDTASVSSEDLSKFENNGLVGYRVEYITTDTTASESKIQNLFRIITSSNKAEPVSVNQSNTTAKSISYRYNNKSTLVFCTLTPSSAHSTTPNSQPFIGVVGQKIILTNTYFNPIMLEVEMVDHDVETLAYALLGNQSKSVEDGKYTIYNFDNDIYKQYDLYEVKDLVSGKPMYEVREERDNIDFDKDFNNVKV